MLQDTCASRSLSTSWILWLDSFASSREQGQGFPAWVMHAIDTASAFKQQLDCVRFGCLCRIPQAAAAAASAEQQQQQQQQAHSAGGRQSHGGMGGGSDDAGGGVAGHGPASDRVNLDSHLAAKAGMRPAAGYAAGRKAEDDWGEEPLGDDLLPM